MPETKPVAVYNCEPGQVQVDVKTPKPCPFCGGEGDLMVPEFDNGALAVVMCLSCFATGAERISDSDAIGAWNTRKSNL